MSSKTRAEQICEFLLEHPDSSIAEIETANGMSHHLTGVHLYRLKKNGLIINTLRGRYRVTDEGRNLAIKSKALPSQTLLIKKEPKPDGGGSQDAKRQPSLYRVTIQGEAFAHDAIVDEKTARKVAHFLIDPKRM